MRGATLGGVCAYVIITISIRAPHAGSDSRAIPTLQPIGISIRAPHAGSDYIDRMGVLHISISIRAPHAGSDRYIL